MKHGLVKQCLALRHVAFEDLDAFEPALIKAGYEVKYCDVPLADMKAFDPLAPELLIVLGGPIGVYENALYPFLDDELVFIEKRLKQDLPTLGICLGAQLMAHALGARVFPSGIKEIGFMPLSLTEAGEQSCLSPFAEDGMTLHWHGDSFDLPAGATLLASTGVCAHQAFALSANVVGFQFHPEASGEKLEAWLVGHTAELQKAGIDIAGLRADAKALSASLKNKAEQVLSHYLEGLAAK